MTPGETMAASINFSPVHRYQDLLGRTVLVIGGSSGIGLETARLARAKAMRSTSAASKLRATLPIGRVVGPADIAALAVHLMTNTAITGATFDIDGGQQLVEG
jgi:NAD(P)-dependent dehydrogenase (short-subunit alcohol dehydrogenase family)